MGAGPRRAAPPARARRTPGPFAAGAQQPAARHKPAAIAAAGGARKIFRAARRGAAAHAAPALRCGVEICGQLTLNPALNPVLAALMPHISEQAPPQPGVAANNPFEDNGMAANPFEEAKQVLSPSPLLQSRLFRCPQGDGKEPRKIFRARRTEKVLFKKK